MLSLPSKNKTLVIAAKNYAERDIKVSWSCLISLNLFTLSKKKQPPEMFRNLTKFTGKHLCQSLFFNKVAGFRHK